MYVFSGYNSKYAQNLIVLFCIVRCTLDTITEEFLGDVRNIILLAPSR
jgi:hypothetical protein